MTMTKIDSKKPCYTYGHGPLKKLSRRIRPKKSIQMWKVHLNMFFSEQFLLSSRLVSQGRRQSSRELLETICVGAVFSFVRVPQKRGLIKGGVYKRKKNASKRAQTQTNAGFRLSEKVSLHLIEKDRQAKSKNVPYPRRK